MQSKTKLSALNREPAGSYGDVRAQQIEMAKWGKPSAFKIRGQMLSQGRTETVLAASEGLTVRLKVYASGGENALHAHAIEDHVFLVLQGGADFFDEDGPLASLVQNQGVLIPKGSYYRFNAHEGQPLVMIRVGTPNEAAQGLEGRVSIHGTFANADSKDNRTEPVEYIDGSFYGDGSR